VDVVGLYHSNCHLSSFFTFSIVGKGSGPKMRANTFKLRLTDHAASSITSRSIENRQNEKKFSFSSSLSAYKVPVEACGRRVSLPVRRHFIWIDRVSAINPFTLRCPSTDFKSKENVGLAERFAREGIVALVYDKRGPGNPAVEYEGEQTKEYCAVKNDAIFSEEARPPP
jgi:hypothetical protein